MVIGVRNKPTVVRGGARVYLWRRAHMMNLQTIMSRPKRSRPGEESKERQREEKREETAQSKIGNERRLIVSRSTRESRVRAENRE